MNDWLTGITPKAFANPSPGQRPGEDVDWDWKTLKELTSAPTSFRKAAGVVYRSVIANSFRVPR
jgi:hypothetical protein